MPELMQHLESATAQHRRRRGVSLVELLVALSISAALLTAVAIAVDASFKGYAINQSQAQLMQRARLSLNRMMTYIRSTTEHLPDDDDAQDDFENGLVTQASAIRMITKVTDATHSEGVIFRQTGNELQMVPFTIVGTTLTEGTARTLLMGVGANDFRITFEPQRSAQAAKTGSKYDQLRRASIVLTIHPSATTAVTGEDANAAQSVTLSTSVMPRRNIW
jgi:prepilin-type N-terminal cleavage/methylation domain-containing protein